MASPVKTKKKVREPEEIGSSKRLKEDKVAQAIDDLQTEVDDLGPTMDLRLLRKVLDAADHAYYETGEPLFPDPVYDRLRDIYLKRLPPAKAKAYKGEVSIKDGGTSKLPTRVLPIYMSSLEKLKNDPKALARWIKKYPGPYWLRAKLDGISLLYHRDPETKTYHLSSRHDKVNGGILDPLLTYMRFPSLHPGEIVRGELTMATALFDKKHKGTRKGRDTVRDSVSGAVNAVVAEDRKGKSKSSVDPDFVRDFEFVAYEFMPGSGPKDVLPFETQIAKLLRRKFKVVDHFKAETLDEPSLEAAFLGWRGGVEAPEGSEWPVEPCAYDMDGVVFSNGAAHPRPTDRDPKFARAFKMDVKDQMADTRVVAVEWRPSPFGYLKPRIKVEPVRISNHNYEYCSGKNAKYIRDAGIGPGTEITLIRSNDVIPDVKAVRVKAEPSFPDIPYHWITEVEIAEVGFSDERQIQVLARFFTKLGVEGLKATSVAKLYGEGYTSVKDWLGMEVKDIGGKFPGIGKRLAEKWVRNIQMSLGMATMDLIINAAGLCGRGIGSRRMAWVFQKIFNATHDPMAFYTMEASDLKKLCMEVEGIGDKVIDQMLESRGEAEKWWNDQLTDEYREVIIDNTADKFEAKEEEEVSKEPQTCKDLVVLMTGFHDKSYEAAICARGGTLAKSFTKKVNLLLVKDLAMKPNAKTRKAAAEGIPVMGAIEFKSKYMV